MLKKITFLSFLAVLLAFIPGCDDSDEENGVITANLYKVTPCAEDACAGNYAYTATAAIDDGILMFNVDSALVENKDEISLKIADVIKDAAVVDSDGVKTYPDISYIDQGLTVKADLSKIIPTTFPDLSQEIGEEVNGLINSDAGSDGECINCSSGAPVPLKSVQGDSCKQGCAINALICHWGCGSLPWPYNIWFGPDCRSGCIKSGLVCMAACAIAYP